MHIDLFTNKIYNEIVVSDHNLVRFQRYIMSKRCKQGVIDRSKVHGFNLFNRTYLQSMELFSNSYLDVDSSLTSNRVLIELYLHDGYTAANLAKLLGIDRSHIARIVRDHVKEGFIIRNNCPTDARILELHLTEKGITRAEQYMKMSEDAVSKRIETLSEIDRTRLIEAFNTINDILKY